MLNFPTQRAQANIGESFKFNKNNFKESSNNNLTSLSFASNYDSVSFKGTLAAKDDFTAIHSMPTCLDNNNVLSGIVSQIADEANLMQLKVLSSLAKDDNIRLGEKNEFIDPEMIPILKDNWLEIKNYIASAVFEELCSLIESKDSTNTADSKEVIYQYLRMLPELEIVPDIAERYMLPPKKKSSILDLLKPKKNNSEAKIAMITDKLLTSNLPNASIIKKDYIDMAYNILNRSIDDFLDWDTTLGKEKAQTKATINALDVIGKLGDYNEEYPRLIEIYSNKTTNPKIRKQILVCLRDFYNRAAMCVDSFESLLGRNGPTGVDLIKAQRCMDTLNPILNKN